MPRRSPGEIRSSLPLRIPRGRPATIRSLSGSTNHQIIEFEKRHHLLPGAVASAIESWSRALDPHPNGGVSLGYGTTVWRDMHARTLLNDVIRQVRRRAKRELSRTLLPLDDRVLRRTMNNPYAPAGDPWWKRRAVD